MSGSVPAVGGSDAARTQRAAALVDLGRFAEARALLAPLIAATSQDPVVWCLLARCELGLNDPQRCLAAANQATMLDPASEWAHRLRSKGHGALGRWTAAVESAKAAVSVAPFLPVTHVALAEAYFGANRSMAALDAAQDALRLAPDSAAAHFLVGRVSQRLGRKEAAAAAYEAALAIDPSHSAARNNLGVVAMSQGQTMAAASHFLGSVRADPAQQAAASNVMIGVGSFLAKLSRRTFGAFLVAVALWILAQTSLDNALLDRVVRPGFAVVTVAVVGWIAWRGARVLPRNLLRSLPRSGRPARVGALAVLTLVACVLVAVAPKATSDSVLVGIHLLFVAALIVNLRDRSRKVRRRR